MSCARERHVRHSARWYTINNTGVVPLVGGDQILAGLTSLNERKQSEASPSSLPQRVPSGTLLTRCHRTDANSTRRSWANAPTATDCEDVVLI